MNPFYPFVSERAAHRCEYRHAPEVIFNFPFEVEHIMPTALDGPDDEENLALACRGCNLRKSSHLSGHDESSQSELSLFNPRQDLWKEHFDVDLKTGDLVGLTPTGRATIARLDMNSPVQKEARMLWMRLGLFP